jgi:hypothetical protein
MLLSLYKINFPFGLAEKFGQHSASLWEKPFQIWTPNWVPQPNFRPLGNIVFTFWLVIIWWAAVGRWSLRTTTWRWTPWTPPSLPSPLSPAPRTPGGYTVKKGTRVSCLQPSLVVPSWLGTGNSRTFFYGVESTTYTDKKEKNIFLIYNSDGIGCNVIYD